MTNRKHSMKATNKSTQPKLKTKPKPTFKPTGTRHRKIPCTIDLISRLPDHPLHHILSFLPLKQAGCTSILSHRWRHVWASMQGLKFFVDEFDMCGQQNFISYVNAALQYRLKEDLQVFKTFLFSASPTNRAASARWINHALKNGVRVLHIIIRPNNSCGNVILSRPMLTSQSLEELGLFNSPNAKIITPNDISLCQLKKLSLQRVEFSSAFAKKIISGCPRLEDLNLHYCEVTCSEISCRVLRNLVVEHCALQTEGDKKFYICMPNLIHLSFNQGYVLSQPHNGRFYRQFLQDVRNLKLDVPNLKSLILGGYWITNCPDAVPYFLQHTPMLEKLTLLCNEGLGYWKYAKLVKSSDLHFQCSNLKSVNIKCNGFHTRIEHLTEVLKRNGVSNVNLTKGGSDNEDNLEMLYKIWYWIDFHFLDSIL